MKPSEWLRNAAQRAESGEIRTCIADSEAVWYVFLVMPTNLGKWPSEAEMDATRPMRYLLAAAIAESEGR